MQITLKHVPDTIFLLNTVYLGYKRPLLFGSLNKYIYLCTRISEMSAKVYKYRGVEQLVARQAHNLEGACSSPASATIKDAKTVLNCFASFLLTKAVLYEMSM